MELDIRLLIINTLLVLSGFLAAKSICYLKIIKFKQEITRVKLLASIEKQALLEKHIEDIEELKKLIKDMENEKT